MRLYIRGPEFAPCAHTAEVTYGSRVLLKIKSPRAAMQPRQTGERRVSSTNALVTFQSVEESSSGPFCSFHTLFFRTL